MPQEYSDAALSDELGQKQISNKKFIQVAISAYTILVSNKLKYISFLEARWPLEPKTRVFACRVKKTRNISLENFENTRSNYMHQ